MILLRNNKLEWQDQSEQKTTEVLATKTFNQVKSEGNGYATKGVTYKMINHGQDASPQHHYKYNFKVTQSEYPDDSSLGVFFRVSDTKGEAIAYMLNKGFTVTVDGVEITKKDS